jgi:hypothetical protein
LVLIKPRSSHAWAGKKAEIVRLCDDDEPGDILVRIHGRGITNDPYYVDFSDITLTESP